MPSKPLVPVQEFVYRIEVTRKIRVLAENEQQARELAEKQLELIADGMNANLILIR